MTRGWEVILPGCGGTSTLAREITLAARWLHKPQPVGNQPAGWGFHTARGGIDPGDLCFRPRVVGVAKVWKDIESGDGSLSLPDAAGS